MCSILGQFSRASGCFEFRFVGTIPCDNPNELHITIETPEGSAKITPEHLQERDREWLIIESPSAWLINLEKLKTRFGLKEKTWLPNWLIDIHSEAHGNPVQIHFPKMLPGHQE